MFKATMTLRDVLEHCNNKRQFCEDNNIQSQHNLNMEIELTKDELLKYGLI